MPALNILSLLWSNKWVVLIAAMVAVFSFQGGRVVGHWQGYADGKKATLHEQSQTLIIEEKKHEKNLQNIRRLDDDALVRRYCRWVYDIPYDRCVRTVKPIE